MIGENYISTAKSYVRSLLDAVQGSLFEECLFFGEVSFATV